MGDIDTDSDSIGEPEYGPVVDVYGPAEDDWGGCVNHEPEPEFEDVEAVPHAPIVPDEEDDEVVQNVPNVQIAEEDEQQEHNEDLLQLNVNEMEEDEMPNVTFQILLTLIRNQLVSAS